MTRTFNPPAYREVIGHRIRESEKAVFITVTAISGSLIKAKTVWFPRSQIQKSFYDPLASAGNWKGSVAEWILEKNGFLDDISVPADDEDPGDNTPEAYDPDDSDIPF